MGEGFDRAGWDRRWAHALQRADAIDAHPPSPHLLAEAADLQPGRALDAGAGHGAETLWLADRGWEVTAVDFSRTALDHARGRADARGPDVAGRTTWIEGDLGAWAPPPGRFDLVCCLFVHVAGDVEAFVRRLAAGVAPAGRLLLAGHRPAPGQVQVTVEDATAALGDSEWELLVAEDRPRPAPRSGIDAVVVARRR